MKENDIETRVASVKWVKYKDGQLMCEVNPDGEFSYIMLRPLADIIFVGLLRGFHTSKVWMSENEWEIEFTHPEYKVETIIKEGCSDE